MVQATISQSLDQSARYAGAMVFGVVLAGLLTPLLGAAIVTFSILMLVALILGRWRKLGKQGPQVGVAALFAYSISALAHSVCDLLTDAANSIAKGVPDQDEADALLHRANQVPGAGIADAFRGKTGGGSQEVQPTSAVPGSRELLRAAPGDH